MHGSWRDVFLYAYDATGRMEELSEDFMKKRQERMEEFRAKRKAHEEEIRKKYDERKTEIRDKMREQVREAVKDAGVASKDDLNELKKLVADLSKKVDKLYKKK